MNNKIIPIGKMQMCTLCGSVAPTHEEINHYAYCRNNRKSQVELLQEEIVKLKQITHKQGSIIGVLSGALLPYCADYNDAAKAYQYANIQLAELEEDENNQT